MCGFEPHPPDFCSRLGTWKGIPFFKLTHYRVLQSIDEYGGLTILSDREMDRYDRNGGITGRDRTIYAPIAEYAHVGPHADRRVTTRKLGDPLEHGTTELFVDVDDRIAPNAKP